jgi:hypothetical protein
VVGISDPFGWYFDCTSFARRDRETSRMVLRIERVSGEQLMILRLSGRLQSEHVKELQAQIEGCTQKVMLDLREVKLVDQEIVCFLAVCEANGVELSQCSPYIRDWITRSRASPRMEP